MRKLARILALVLVAATTVIALGNIPDEFRSAESGLLRQSVAFAVTLYAVLGLLLLIGALRRRPWAVTIAVAWAVSVFYAATVATFAWSDPIDRGVIMGGIAAGLSCVLMGWWVVWAARESVRPHIPATSESSSSPR